jgi:hypothetical protein
MTAINLNTDSLTLTIQEAGEANTNSKAGGTAGLVNTKSGINTPIKGLTGGTNITVTEGTNEVTIGVTNDYDNIDVAPKPDVDATHALGSITKTWSDLYLKGYSIQNANSRIEMGSTDNKAVLWEQAGNAFELDTGGADITLRTNSGNNVIVPENLVVNGSLDVNGTLTTIDTTNTAIADRIIELNRGATSNANDIGIVMERGSAGDNATIFWDESADTFRIATTTSDGTETGSMDSVTDAALSASMVTANLTGNVTGNLTGDVTGDVTGDLTGDVTGNIASTGNSSFSGTVNLNGATVNNAAFNLSGNLTGNSAGTHTGAVIGNVTGNTAGVHTGNVTGNLTGNVTGNLTGNVTGNLTGNVTGNLDGQIGETTRASGKFTTVDADGDLDAYRASFTSGINSNSTDYASSNFMVFDNDSIPGAVSALTMVRYLGSDGADTTGFDPRGATMDWEIRSDSGNTNGSATNIYAGGIAGYAKHDNDTHQMHFFTYDDGHSSYTRENAFWFDKNHIVVEKEAEFLSNVYVEGDMEIDFQDANGTLRVNDNDSDQIFELDKERLNLGVPIQMHIFAVNDLPTTLDEGAIAYVTDESTVSGGNCMVFYDGAGWKLMHSPTTTASS